MATAFSQHDRWITRYFQKFRSTIGTFFFAASRHETDSFCWLFLGPQQKAMGRF
jgi:hypothetical protein